MSDPGWPARCAQWIRDPRLAHLWPLVRPPKGPSLCWDVKVGWVPVRDIDPATGRSYVVSGDSPNALRKVSGTPR